MSVDHCLVSLFNTKIFFLSTMHWKCDTASLIILIPLLETIKKHHWIACKEFEMISAIWINIVILHHLRLVMMPVHSGLWDQYVIHLCGFDYHNGSMALTLTNLCFIFWNWLFLSIYILHRTLWIMFKYLISNGKLNSKKTECQSKMIVQAKLTADSHFLKNYPICVLILIFRPA